MAAEDKGNCDRRYASAETLESITSDIKIMSFKMDELQTSVKEMQELIITNRIALAKKDGESENFKRVNERLDDLFKYKYIIIGAWIVSAGFISLIVDYFGFSWTQWNK